MRILAALFGLLTSALVTFAFLAPRLPPNWIPWHAPVLDAPATQFAHFQLNRLKFNSEMCLGALRAAAELSFVSLPDRKIGDDCGHKNVVRIESAPIAHNSEPSATCALAAALYWWEQDLKQQALEIFNVPLARIDHVGKFFCRNVNSEASGRRSQHATANAIDISGFVLADGRRITIASVWNSSGPAAEFVQTARNRACRYFNGVLSPDYNKLHADHLHLDFGPYLICR